MEEKRKIHTSGELLNIIALSDVSIQLSEMSMSRNRTVDCQKRRDERQVSVQEKQKNSDIYTRVPDILFLKDVSAKNLSWIVISPDKLLVRIVRYNRRPRNLFAQSANLHANELTTSVSVATVSPFMSDLFQN